MHIAEKINESLFSPETVTEIVGSNDVIIGRLPKTNDISIIFNNKYSCTKSCFSGAS